MFYNSFFLSGHECIFFSLLISVCKLSLSLNNCRIYVHILCVPIISHKWTRWFAINTCKDLWNMHEQLRPNVRFEYYHHHLTISHWSECFEYLVSLLVVTKMNWLCCYWYCCTFDLFKAMFVASCCYVFSCRICLCTHHFSAKSSKNPPHSNMWNDNKISAQLSLVLPKISIFCLHFAVVTQCSSLVFLGRVCYSRPLQKNSKYLAWQMNRHSNWDKTNFRWIEIVRWSFFLQIV